MDLALKSFKWSRAKLKRFKILLVSIPALLALLFKRTDRLSLLDSLENTSVNSGEWDAEEITRRIKKELYSNYFWFE